MRRMTGTVVLAGALWCGAAWAKKEANLSVVFDPADSDLSCPTAVACFDVTADKNITHIFVDLQFEQCVGEDAFQVTVDGEVVEKLHTRGGPCNHGDREIPRIVWFPLSGNQKSAEVCVLVDDMVPSQVRVGAKAADECVSDVSEQQCVVCNQVASCPDP